MIQEWLAEKIIEGEFKFTVVELIENSGTPSINTKKKISKELLLGRLSEVFIHNHNIDNLEQLKNHIREFTFADTKGGLNSAVRVGDWGEILSYTILKDIRGMTVPIRKLRYKTNQNRSMLGLDILAINNSKEKTLVFAEIKTATTQFDEECGIEAHDQLVNFGSARYSESVSFVSHMLVNEEDYTAADIIDDALLHPETYTVEYDIFLIIDKSLWNKSALDQINSLESLLDPLNTNVVLINGLRDLIEDTYSSCEIVGEEILNGT